MLVTDCTKAFYISSYMDFAHTLKANINNQLVTNKPHKTYGEYNPNIDKTLHHPI